MNGGGLRGHNKEGSEPEAFEGSQKEMRKIERTEGEGESEAGIARDENERLDTLDHIHDAQVWFHCWPSIGRFFAGKSPVPALLASNVYSRL